MAKLLIFYILFSLASTSFGADLDKVRKAYFSGKISDPNKYLSNIKPDDINYLDAKRFLSDHYFWTDNMFLSRKNAYQGLIYSPEETFHEYYFVNRLIKNRIFVEGFIGNGSPYDSYGFFLEYSRNYYNRNWFSLGYSTETRTQDSDTVSASKVIIGHILNLSNTTYIQSYLNLSPEKAFFPDYGIENEVFYTNGNNTYSLALILNSYKESSALVVSPHWRHDLDKLYFGFRANAILTESTPNYYFNGYLGYALSFKNHIKVSYQWGKVIEDASILNETEFTDLNIEYKHKLTPKVDLGVRYDIYNSELTKQNKLFFNLLFKY